MRDRALQLATLSILALSVAMADVLAGGPESLGPAAGKPSAAGHAEGLASTKPGFAVAGDAPGAGEQPAAQDDLLLAISALVQKNEAALPAPLGVDARRLVLAKEVLAEYRESLLTSESRYLEAAADLRRSNPGIPPPVIDVMLQVVRASSRPEVMLARTAQHLAVRLDEEALRAGLEWERSDQGRRFRTALYPVESPGERAAMNAFFEQRIRKGFATDLARMRACGEIVTLADLAAPGLIFAESMGNVSLVVMAIADGIPVDAMSLGEPPAAARRMLRETLAFGVLMSCLFAFREMEDVELDRSLIFLRSDVGGRYSRGRAAAEAQMLNELGEVVFRTMLQLAPRLQKSGKT